MSAGVTVTPLEQYPDERGSVKLILQDGHYFSEVKQVYVSTVYPGTIKGWHKHKTKALNYVCVSGLIRLVIATPEASMPVQRAKPLGGEFQEIVMGDTNYVLVHIPPGYWNAFMGLGDREAVIVNCATRVYSEDDIERLPYNYFAYDWTFKHG